jgi:hypothetical protein
MLSLHTQIENLANLLHHYRLESAGRVDRADAYRSLVAAILDVPVTSLREPVLQPALQPVPFASSSRRHAA